MQASETISHCHKCQMPLQLEVNKRISRQEECPKCHSSIYCCKMCNFYDISSYNECREPVANRIVDKEKANFCDFFKLSGGPESGPSTKDLFSAANSLFKD